MSSLNPCLTNLKCLICFSSFQSEGCKNPENFTTVFNVFCRLLEINLTDPVNKWNFQYDDIPFCPFCCSAVERLNELNDQFEFLQKQINHILYTTKQNILKSGSASILRKEEKSTLLLEDRVVFFRQQVTRGGSGQCNNAAVGCEDNKSPNKGLLKIELPLQCNGDDEVHLSFVDRINDEHCNAENEISENDPLDDNAENESRFGRASVGKMDNSAVIDNLKKDGDSLFLDPNDCDSSVQSATNNTSNTVTDPELSVVSAKCSFCGKSFKTKSALQEHIKNHSDECKYKCVKCGDKETEMTWEAFRLHQRNHHPKGNGNESQTNTKNFGEAEQNETFQCKGCKKSYTQIQDLEDHLKTHCDDQRAYKCELCDKTFTQICGLNRHQKLHTGEKKYKCDFCNRSYARMDYFIIHRRIHTGEKPYKCEFCEKSFIRSSQLKLHNYSHTGEKPYKCNHCNMYFGNRARLARHQGTHTSQKKV